MEEKYYYTEKRAVIKECISLIFTVLGFIFMVVLMKLLKRFVQPYEMEEWELLERIIPWIYIGIFILYHISEIISIYLRKRCMRLIIRPNEIVFYRGFFTVRKTTVPVNKIKDCSTESGPLQQICGTMTLLVTTAGDDREICFTDIANGEDAESLINRLIR